MKKKILIGTVNMEIGGIERTLIGLLKKINYDLYDVDLLLLKTNGDFIDEIPKSVNIITPYKNKTLERIVNSRNIICKIIKHTLFNYVTSKHWINNKEYDCAISYSGYYPFIDAFIANTNAKKKLIWVHTDLRYLYNTDKLYKIRFNYTKNKYDKYDNVICVSESIKSEFIKLMPSLKDKTLVQWNIIDINKNNKKYPKLDGEKIIVSVGRVCDQKRFDKLVFLHKKLIKNNIKVKTYLVGDGKLDDIKELIKKYKVEDTFILLGKQLNVEEIIKQADLFVLTSDYEGLPTVLFETLDANVPFVGTNVTGVKDIVNYIAPKNSCLLANNNITSLYEKIIDALNGKINKNFKFNIEDYNDKCLKEFYKKMQK
ncbi:MAG: glycosyltransferase [bacterium]|nr:glycosyltransferase [bacterium]